MAEKRKDKDGRILPENVTQRKDGTYMWRKSINGKNYCIYAKTLGEIKQKRNVALGEIEKGEYKGKHEKMAEERELAKTDMTLNEWFFRWEKIYRIGNIKETTLHREHCQYMKMLSRTLGKMKITSIRQIDVTDVFNKLHEDYAYSTLFRLITLLIQIFKAAIDNGIIEKNPAKGALKVKKEKPKERRVLTEQEEERFLNYIGEHSYFKKYLPLFTVGFGTGMRIGEILSLTWEDIDFEKNVIHVNKTLSRIDEKIKSDDQTGSIITSPKTENSIRDIPMIGKVRNELIKQREIQPKCKVTIDGYTDFVFTSKNGNAFYAVNIRQTILNIINHMNESEIEAAKKEGREPVLFERFSPHCMRHTFTTRCYEKGVREKVMQKILGHSKLDMTLNVYTHTTDKMIEDDMHKIDG